jgi:hypothetical protein
MDITLSIDTDKTLSAGDRAILQALLDGTPPAPPTPAPVGAAHVRPNSAAGAVSQITDAMARGQNGARPSVKLPIAQQPGVTAIESTREETPVGD